MNRDERKETIIIIMALAIAGCTFAAVIITKAEPALYIFSLPLFFAVMCLTPAAWSRIFSISPAVLARLSISTAVSTLPFYIIFLTGFPYRISSVVFIILFLAVEGIYWAFLYTANRILYSGALFVTGFLPLLVYSFVVRSAGSGRIFAVSPLGFLFFICRNEFRTHIASILTAHAVPLICAFIIILLSRKNSESSSNEL